MPALKLRHYLQAEGELQPLVAKALEIDALSKLCKDFLPPELAPLVVAANLKNGRLVVLAANAAAAAKLKLLSESLSEFLLKQGSKVNSVSVRVQPGGDHTVDAAPQKRPQLSAATIAELQRLHGRMPESSARKALETLLKRHSTAAPTARPAGVRKKTDQA